MTNQTDRQTDKWTDRRRQAGAICICLSTVIVVLQSCPKSFNMCFNLEFLGIQSCNYGAKAYTVYCY